MAAAAAGVAGLLVGRLLTAPSASSPDAWAYAAWGQAVARLERPAYEPALTTPKPLSLLLGAVAAPFPADRAFAVLVALAVAVLVTALLVAGLRAAGPVAGAVAAATFLLAADVGSLLWFSLIDAVAAALVVAAVATRGHARVGLLVAAGLLRPEAWPLAGLAALLEARGGPARRLGIGVAAAALPVALWLLTDLAASGDALAVVNRTEAIVAVDGQTDAAVGVSDVPRLLLDRLTGPGGLPPVLVLLGAVGVAAQLWRASPGERDLLPAAVLVVWPAVLGLELLRDLPANARFLLPVVAVLALGCGLLPAALAPALTRLRAAPVAALAVVLATVVCVVRLDQDGEGVPRQRAENAAVAATLPAVEAVLDCGRLRVTGSRGATRVVPQLAARGRTALDRFEVSPEGADVAGVLRVGGRGGVLPAGWPRQRTALGALAVRPDCRAASR